MKINEIKKLSTIYNGNDLLINQPFYKQVKKELLNVIVKDLEGMTVNEELMF